MVVAIETSLEIMEVTRIEGTIVTFVLCNINVLQHITYVCMCICAVHNRSSVTDMNETSQFFQLARFPLLVFYFGNKIIDFNVFGLSGTLPSIVTLHLRQIATRFANSIQKRNYFSQWGSCTKIKIHYCLCCLFFTTVVALQTALPKLLYFAMYLR